MKPARIHELVVRRDAAQAVVDQHKDKPFVWGRRDCGRSIVAPVLKALGHHCPVARFGHYTNEIGARRALLKNGFRSMEDFLDQVPLMRIGHASLLPADFVGIPTPNFDWLVMGLSLGNGRVFAFIDVLGDGNPTGQVVQPREIAAAWRVPFKVKGVG